MDIKEYIESGIIESYVLGLTSAEESAEVETMAKEHYEIKQAIFDFELLFEKQANKDLVQPPAQIKSNITNILFADGALKESKNLSLAGKTNLAPVRRINLSNYIAAASIILLIISTALNFYFYSSFKDSTNKYEALLNERNTLQANNAAYKQSLQMFEDTAMMRIDMKGMPGKEQNLATILWDKNSKDVYINTDNMQQTPAGKQYQLWAIVDGKPVDAGVINNCIGLCKMKKIDHAQAFAITLEKQGGSKTPTLTDMYVIGKVS